MRVWCWCCLWLGAPRVFRAPESRAAREIATREPAARSGRSRSPARPRRHPRAPQPGPPVPPVPSAPVGPGVLACGPARTRCPVRPRRRLRVSRPDLACPIAEPTPNFARNSLMAPSNHEFRSLELQRFQTLLNVHPIELRATLSGAWPHRPSNFACNSFTGVSWCEA